MHRFVHHRWFVALGDWHPATAKWVQAHESAGPLGCEAVLLLRRGRDMPTTLHRTMFSKEKCLSFLYGGSHTFH
jgi:hypothetical protein